jgi:hypothetical protein
MLGVDAGAGRAVAPPGVVVSFAVLVSVADPAAGRETPKVAPGPAAERAVAEVAPDAVTGCEVSAM